MKIKIYQINPHRDARNVLFLSLQNLKRRSGKENPDSRIYDTVYENDLDCETLEGIFQILNVSKPDDYYGRSLSVSDVVEVISGGKHAPGFYYCDTVGFKEVLFQPELARSRTIRVVLLEPGKPARLADIDRSLRGLQKIVDGYIEILTPFEDRSSCLVCNEEGKLLHLPLNRSLYMDGRFIDIIAGTCFICGLGGGELGNLTEQQQKKYLDLYRLPEIHIIT